MACLSLDQGRFTVEATPVDIFEGFQPFSWSVTTLPGGLQIYSSGGLITVPTLPMTRTLQYFLKMSKIRTLLLAIKDVDIMFA